jgi:hypothetical protein
MVAAPARLHRMRASIPAGRARQNFARRRDWAVQIAKVVDARGDRLTGAWEVIHG